MWLTVSSDVMSLHRVLDGVKSKAENHAVNSQDGPPDARSALLAAARDELFENGVTAVGLRAVARRAGLSHAAPGYFFRDRAGMLTALAAQGFDALADALDRAGDSAGLADLGGVYVDFGLRSGPLFDLMFQRDLLHPSDPALLAAQQRAMKPLLRATSAGSDPDPLMSWALVHGLVTLARQHALPVEQEDVEPTMQRVVRRFEGLLSAGDR